MFEPRKRHQYLSRSLKIVLDMHQIVAYLLLTLMAIHYDILTNKSIQSVD